MGKPKYVMLRGKRRPLCDYGGECTNLAYKEVYPGLGEKRNKPVGWSYLCRKHFKKEQARFKNKLPYTNID
jgi:hypothetical protein